MALVTTVVTQIVLFADRTIFQMFGMHINGFVWNLMTTKGWIESMGGDQTSDVVYGLLGLGFAAVHVGMLVMAMRLNLWHKACDFLGAR